MAVTTKGWEDKGAVEKFTTRSQEPDFWSGVEPFIQKVLIPLYNTGKNERREFNRALDAGAGWGRHSFYLLRKISKEVVALEPSEEFVKRMREIDKKEYGGGSIEIIKGGLPKTSFKNGEFNLIVCWDVLAHGTMDKIKDSAEELKRLLAPGGVLVLGTLSTNHKNFKIARKKGKEIEKGTFVGGFEGEWGGTHHYFTREELEELFKGLRIVRLEEEIRETGYNKGGIHWAMYAEKPLKPKALS
ncbi:MAG: class I SAM-dependent methyltransferase [Candidatus Micrarchaeota archaeon]|nr:class I SAM-dependent methyltransferase [Candidatus Micrarchaeota archaeon]